MNEHDFIALVERNRNEVPVGHPPADLLRVARVARRQRRLKGLGITLATLVVLGTVGLGVHALTEQRTPPGAGAADRSPTTGTTVTIDPTTGSQDTTARATRPVGINGWVVTVPDGWGTDQVGCDRTTATGPTVVFDHRDRVRPRCPRSPSRPLPPSVHITSGAVPAAPWRTINGVDVRRVVQRSSCPTCATITVPSTSAIFQIRARNRRQLHSIEHSLRPVSGRSITIPVWQVPEHGAPALDQMTQISLADGLRPQTVEEPSSAPPGQFLRSLPPMGTPVDLGRGITIVYSAGDLAAYATTASLHRHGWEVSAAGDFSPPFTRDQARAAIARSGGRPGPDVFLRTLAIVRDAPSGERVRATPVWLVVRRLDLHRTPTTYTITAVDADNGRVIESRTGFVGRRCPSHRPCDGPSQAP